MFAAPLKTGVTLLLSAALLWLGGCGGGRESSSGSPPAAAPQAGSPMLQMPRAAVAEIGACQLGQPGTPDLITYRMVDGQCLRSFAGFDRQLVPAQQRRRIQAVSAALPRVPTPTELFDWAERTYPQFFPIHESNRTLGPYVYRYYASAQNHAAVDGTKVYVQGPISGGGLVYVAEISDFACLVFPDSCGPQPKPCNPVANWSAGGNTCTPNPDQTAQINSGASFTFTDSLGDTRGSATYTCNDGTLTAKDAPSCEQRALLACNTTGLSWTVATNTCTANPGEPTQLAHGSSHTFRASAGRVGTAGYACNDGTLTATAVPVCELPAPVVCKPTTVSWTVGENTCVADGVPPEIAGGGSYAFFDLVGVPTGFAIYTCTPTGLQITNPLEVQCEGIPRIPDSFGGDGGGADGSASGDGTAGDGAPIAGALVTIVDVNGRTVSATTNSIGYYRVKLTGFVPPMVITVTRPDGRTRRSVNTVAPKPNGYIFMAVTGLTDKIASDVARAAGFPGAASLTPQMVRSNPQALAAAINAVRNDGLINQMIITAGLDPLTFDPLNMPFRADGTGYDMILDNLVITTDSTGATVVQSINCTAPKSWTVGSVTCTPDAGEETTFASGTSIIHRDSSFPTTGSVGWSCLKAVVQPPISPSCINNGTSGGSAPGR